MQNFIVKAAQLGGGGGETEFEQAFSSLAYAYLRDKAPRLLDFMIGFQLVDRNEDNTKAMGVFGFQIDNQWLYAPVFFLNGDLKGHELLYLKNNDSFVPLKENWINYVMSRKPHVLGESSSSKLRDLGGIYPDIRTLSIPPSIGGGKRASDSAWLKPVLPMLAAFKTKMASSFYRGLRSTQKLNQAAVVREPFAAALTKAAQNLDLNRVMPNSFELIKTAFVYSERYPLLKQAFYRFYGKDCFSRWTTGYKDMLAQQQFNILPKKQAAAKPYMPGSLLIPTERPAAPVDHVKEGKLRLYVSEFVISNEAKELDETERERLLKDTVLIKDHRKGEQVSRAYNTQIEAKLVNPSETSVYRVLEKPGNFEKMLVVMHGSSNRGREPIATVVRLDGDKAWLNTHATNIFADQISEKDEWRDWFDGLSDSQTLSKGGVYIAIDESGSATVPFVVRDNLGDGNYKVDFRCDVNYKEERSTALPRLKKEYGFQESRNMPCVYDALLCVDKEGKRGTKLRAIAGELRVPGNFKFFKLEDEAKPSSSMFSILPCCDSRSEARPIELGQIDDIQLLFVEKTARLKVFNNGTDVYIDSVLGSDRMTKKAALWCLVSTHGLREKIAREILARAEQKGSIVYRIEYAPGYGAEKKANPNMSVLANGPDAPLYDDMVDERSIEQYGPRTAVPTQYGSESAYRLNHMSADQTDPGVWDPWQNYEAGDFNQSLQVAQQAGAQGQKEVFDTSMIQGLLKSVRQDSLVERYLGTLMESLDALGRLLMNFYWHQEEFEDRYGKSDLPELEDSIRNAFEALGDITLFLKEKTIESPFGQGEISLEEVARN